MAGCLAVVAILAAGWLLITRPELQPRAWYVTGTSGDARELVLGFPVGACNDSTPEVRVRRRTAEQLEVEVTYRSPGCSTLIGVQPEPIRLRVAEPLRGEAIVGPRMTPPQATLTDPPSVPNVLGLAPDTAEQVLADGGMTPVRRRTTGDRAGRPYVARQRPEPARA